MKKPTQIAISAAIVTVGVALAAYPFISNYLYEHNQQKAISGYESQMKSEPSGTLDHIWEEAQEYNHSLNASDVLLTDPFDPEAFAGENNRLYEETLNFSDDGLMGYLEIPVLDLSLGIYHGTGSQSLEKGVGHLENSSLPVGGEGTHAVLSAHTGLPGKKLFTDLELMEVGDVFYIHILTETLAYQVDQIKVVKPENTRDLQKEFGEDYVTLVTCTPYGVNSHRLLVRGVRVPYEPSENTGQVKTGSHWMRQYLKGILTGVLILIVLEILYYLRRRRRGRR